MQCASPTHSRIPAHAQTEGKPDPTFDKPAGHVADPQAHVYGSGTGPMHRPAVGSEATPPQPELGIGAKVMEATKSALGMGTGPSSEKAE
jgi:hypothetical protein